MATLPEKLWVEEINAKEMWALLATDFELYKSI